MEPRKSRSFDYVLRTPPRMTTLFFFTLRTCLRQRRANLPTVVWLAAYSPAGFKLTGR
jgi:hypothetical protein